MYNFMQNILSDKKGGDVFTLFGGWHFLYMILTAVAIIIACLALKKDEAKKKMSKICINIAVGLYIADFFLMPLAYGEIDIEKLPFHACTAMCVMCFLSCHNPFLERYRKSFVLLGFISNLVYLIYPAGVMWHAVHPLSYRVIQTLVFHSVMTVYGFMELINEREKMKLKNCYQDLLVLVGMTLWALLGNNIYNGTSEGYSHFFNWFFVVRDPFYALPEAIAPYIMPALNILIFFAAEVLVYQVFSGAKRVMKGR